ncbi:DMT family transporter [Qipengyuania sp. 1NDH17]|uniref:DMT family transporter n=1 Tax=Qipengyuania polymorpha TaxID=2867234 RepID=A0ABS7IV55_9SPHN|nr:DMT family transporter [Qipengyuania polymorpha]MBX7456734.1 DMT family transporter [Qipengyuania polymorpha]
MQTSERSGILFALCGFALLSVGDAVVKTMAGEFSPLGAATLRFIIGAIGVSALLYRKEGPRAFRPVSYKLQAARGFCLAAASLFFFSAVFVMPLATVMAIAFVAPVIVALLSGPLLGEKVRPAVWLASFAALVGVVLVLRPNLGELGLLALLPLGSALFFALMIIANRASAGQGSALSMQVFMQVGALPLLFIAAIGGHLSGAESLRLEMPDWTVFARCALVALTASTAHWLAYIGTQRAGAATIAPTTYVQMLVATFMGWWWFDNVPDLLTLAGAAIIIGAGLLLWWSTPREPARLRGN